MSEIKVRRANVILRVSEEQKAEYLAKGFDVIGENGTVIEFTVPSDMNVLKKAYSDHIKEIEELKKQIGNSANTQDGDLQADYDSLLDDYNELVEENEKLNDELDSLKAELEKPAKKSNKKS